MRHAGRAARIHPGAERPLQTEVGQAAADDPDLFPEVVGDRLGRLHAGREAQQAGDIARLGVAAQDLLLDARPAGAARRRARDRSPGNVVGAEEFEGWLRQCYSRK